MRAKHKQQLESMIGDACLPVSYRISYKTVFGAVAAYVNDQIFMSCGTFGVALKLDDETCASLLDEGAGKPLKYFEKAGLAVARPHGGAEAQVEVLQHDDGLTAIGGE